MTKFYFYVGVVRRARLTGMSDGLALDGTNTPDQRETSSVIIVASGRTNSNASRSTDLTSDAVTPGRIGIYTTCGASLCKPATKVRASISSKETPASMASRAISWANVNGISPVTFGMLGWLVGPPMTLRAHSKHFTISAFIERLFAFAAAAILSRMPSGKRTMYLSESCAVRAGAATWEVTGGGVFSGGVGFFMQQRILALSHFAILALSHK